MKIQLKSKEAYNILVKNEAHIRMASSSYRVAANVRYLALSALLIPLLLLFPTGINLLNLDFHIIIDYLKNVLIISSMPVSIYFLNKFIRNAVIEFLHYQRLREIFFVIQVYDELFFPSSRQ